MKNYVEKAAQVFRKKNPTLSEHRERVGKREIPVFIDDRFLEDYSMIPEEVKKMAIENAPKDGMSRIDGFAFDSPYDIGDGLIHYLGLQSSTYNVWNERTGKLIYSVLQINGFRYNAYRKLCYGEKKLCCNMEQRWKTSIQTEIFDLFCG